MNDMQIFTSKEFGDIRTVENGSNPLFVGMDVAKRLGYSRPSEAVTKHCRSTLKRRIPHPQNPSKTIEVLVIPCGDVLRLVASSKLPSAQRFESWIFDEVMPSIMHTGKYIMPQVPQLPQPSQNNNLEIARQLLLAAESQAQRITSLESQYTALENTVKQLPTVKPDWIETAKFRIEAITGHSYRNSGRFLEFVYAELEKSENISFKQRISRQSRKMLAKGATAREIHKISKLYIVSIDEKLRNAFDRILNSRGAA